VIGVAVPVLAGHWWGYAGVGFSPLFLGAMWFRELLTPWTGGWHPHGDVLDFVAWVLGWSVGALVMVT